MKIKDDDVVCFIIYLAYGVLCLIIGFMLGYDYSKHSSPVEEIHTSELITENNNLKDSIKYIDSIKYVEIIKVKNLDADSSAALLRELISSK